MDSLGEVGDRVDRRGGDFLVGAPRGDVYLLGLRIRTTGVAERILLVPMLARIDGSAARCAYIGSVYLYATPEGFRSEIKDDLEGALRRRHSAVRGCRFTRVLATFIEPSEDEAFK